MLDIGLSFLVYLAPLILLALLTAALGGVRGCGPRRVRVPAAEVRAGARVHEDRSPVVLASDAERDEALQAISYAVGEGRLTLDEAKVRIEAVLHSRHRHELTDQVGDLPQRAQPLPVDRRQPSRRQLLPLGLAALAAVGVLAAVIAQAVAGAWELWPVAVAGCTLWAVRPRH
ncbi:MAG: DUF1707 domain-containing protein [Actinomycetota bacterium]|nr:DUF1707 domain-containing protein [Actinomycetota bacterium]